MDDRAARRRLIRALQVWDQISTENEEFDFHRSFGPNGAAVVRVATLLGRALAVRDEVKAKLTADRLERADNHLREGKDAKGPGVEERRAAVLRDVRLFVDKCHRGPERAQRLAELLISRLRVFDRRFSDLDPSFVARELRRTKPSAKVTKGGAGNVAPPSLAAKLCVNVQAFDDTDLTKSRKTFQKVTKQSPDK